LILGAALANGRMPVYQAGRRGLEPRIPLQNHSESVIYDPRSGCTKSLTPFDSNRDFLRRPFRSLLCESSCFECGEERFLGCVCVAVLDHRQEESSGKIFQDVQVRWWDAGLLAVRELAAQFVKSLELLLEPDALRYRYIEKDDDSFGDALADRCVSDGEERFEGHDQVHEPISRQRCGRGIPEEVERVQEEFRELRLLRSWRADDDGEVVDVRALQQAHGLVCEREAGDDAGTVGIVAVVCLVVGDDAWSLADASRSWYDARH